MRALIWRYVVNAHSEHEMEPVTEDDVHELKSDLSSWRCELLDILHRNGMDIGGIDMKEKSECLLIDTDSLLIVGNVKRESLKQTWLIRNPQHYFLHSAR